MKNRFFIILAAFVASGIIFIYTLDGKNAFQITLSSLSVLIFGFLFFSFLNKNRKSRKNA